MTSKNILLLAFVLNSLAIVGQVEETIALNYFKDSIMSTLDYDFVVFSGVLENANKSKAMNLCYNDYKQNVELPIIKYISLSVPNSKTFKSKLGFWNSVFKSKKKYLSLEIGHHYYIDGEAVVPVYLYSKIYDYSYTFVIDKSLKKVKDYCSKSWVQ